MTLSTIQFPLDDNTFILNGQMRSISPSAVPGEEVQPNDYRGYYRRRLWAGIGLWAFITMSAVVAIPIGGGAIVIALKARPAPPTVAPFAPVAVEAMPTAASPAPIAEAAPSAMVIDDVHRLAAAVAFLNAHPPHQVTSHSPSKRIVPRYRIAPNPEAPQEPQDASLGCPPSVCFPWNRDGK